MPFILLIFFGIFASVCALILEFFTLSIFSSFLFLETVFSLKTFLFFLVLAIIEEISKYIFLFQYKKRTSFEHISFFRLISYSVFFGTGFSLVEYILSLPSLSFISPIPLAFFPTFLLHTSLTFCFIFFLSRFHSQGKTLTKTSFSVLFGTIIIHFLYNVFVFLH
ncbi:MAG: hypothetical protein PHH40_02630 [Candidatus Moranbacteria bacterium]|nr:hypothetical protein [Candidatus Moranbacteria bacterium]MDD3965208.1 hypothetical protein [Candidatus Moranbacteria bacterium]